MCKIHIQSAPANAKDCLLGYYHPLSLSCDRRSPGLDLMYYPLVVVSSVLCAAPAAAGYPSPSLLPSFLFYPSCHWIPFPSLYHLEALSSQISFCLYHLAISSPAWLPPVPLFFRATWPSLDCHPYPSSSLFPYPLAMYGSHILPCHISSPSCDSSSPTLPPGPLSSCSSYWYTVSDKCALLIKSLESYHSYIQSSIYI